MLLFYLMYRMFVCFGQKLSGDFFCPFLFFLELEWTLNDPSQLAIFMTICYDLSIFDQAPVFLFPPFIYDSNCWKYWFSSVLLVVVAYMYVCVYGNQYLCDIYIYLPASFFLFLLSRSHTLVVHVIRASSSLAVFFLSFTTQL